jgi:transcriptional regulator with XRE-family HTH domain
MPTESPRNLGAEIRAEMGRQRISMLRLSTLTGIPRTTLADQINGGRITVDTLAAIAAALHVTASSLLGEAVA